MKTTVNAGTPHLLVAVSGHGYGHLAQLLPVLDVLAEQLPTLQLTLRSSLPATLLEQRIPIPFRLLPGELDFGMRMASALEVDVEASARDYESLHQDWEQRVSTEAQVLQHCGADAVLADIPYLALAAAARANIPSIALCSLNWAAIYRHYCSHRPEAAGILCQMQAAYNSAERFLCPQPAMPMPGLDNTESIQALARPAPACHDEVRRRLGISPATRTLLVGMGGVGLTLPLQRWPRFPGWRLIVPNAAPGIHPDVVSPQQLGMDFPALLGGVDALLSKPGYGTYVEAACQGLPVLYASRPDWPEEPYLNPWLQRHTRAVEIGTDALLAGDFLTMLNALLALPAGPKLQAKGAQQAAAAIMALLASHKQGTAA